MTARARLVLVCTAAAGATLLGTAPSAVAATTGSATAKAVFGNAVTIPAMTASGSGVLGSTLAVVVQTVADALTQTVNSTLSTAVLATLNNTHDTADTTTGPSSYSLGTSINAATLIGLALNGPSGSVTADSTGYSATSGLAHPQLSVLGSNVADLGAATATATCPSAGSPSASVSLSDVSLFGGAVAAKLANGSTTLQVSLNGGGYVGVGSLSPTLTAVPGTSVSVRVDGNLLQVTESVSLSDLLGGLNLAGLLSNLSGLIDTSGTALSLSLTVGPGTAASNVTGSTATAWGLEVGADLTGTVSLDVLGLLGGTASVTIPSGIAGTSYGNLLDLKLGYATCQSGAATTPGSKWVPPGLI